MPQFPKHARFQDTLSALAANLLVSSDLFACGNCWSVHRNVGSRRGRSNAPQSMWADAQTELDRFSIGSRLSRPAAFVYCAWLKPHVSFTEVGNGHEIEHGSGRRHFHIRGTGN